MIRDDRRIKVLEIARTMQISCGRVENIIHDHLKMSKVSARWVLRKLTDHDRDASLHLRRSYMSLSLTLSSLFGRLLLGMKRRFTTGTRRAKLSRCSGDMLHPVLQGSSELYPLLGNSWWPFLWDSKGILVTDYMPPKTTINGQYYAILLLKLCDAIQKKCPGMPTQGAWLLHDNTPIHKSMIAQKVVRDCGFVQLDHLAFSPDLAPSDYFMFRNLKSHLRGVHYPDDEVLQEAVREWLEGQTEDYYFSGNNSLSQKCCKCIELSGEYIEK